MKKQYIIAISGFKNSGKTTIIQNIIPLLKLHGLKIATIKHDGHDFEPDVPNTDTFKHRKSGASGVAIFSDNKLMVTKEIEHSKTIEIAEIIKYFDDSDIILLEGFKNSNFDKLEILRSGVCETPYCKKNVLGYITDVSNIAEFDRTKPVFELNDYKQIAEFILKKAQII